MKNLTKLIYWILIINIFVSLITSFIILAAEGNNHTVNFVWNFNSVYLFSVFLGFIILYPILFFFVYIISFVLMKIIGIFVKK